MNGFPDLRTILDAKRLHVAERKRQTPMEALRALAGMQERPIPVLHLIRHDGPTLISGQIRYAPLLDDGDPIDPVAQAIRCAKAGVDALSLFTDVTIYRGGLDDLMFVVRAVQGFDVPVIAQDYMLDEYQVVEARAAGASGVVLVASLVTSDDLRTLVSATQRNRMTPIVKVANEAELDSAVALSPQVIALGYGGRPGEIEALRRLRERIPGHIRLMVFCETCAVDDAGALAALRADAVSFDAPLLDAESLARLREVLTPDR